MKYEDEVAQQVKKTGKQWEDFAQDMVKLHNMMLNPRMPDKMMQDTMLFYTARTLDFLEIMKDFNTYYQGRKNVIDTYQENLLKVSDKVEAMLDIQAPDTGFLDESKSG